MIELEEASVVKDLGALLPDSGKNTIGSKIQTLEAAKKYIIKLQMKTD